MIEARGLIKSYHDGEREVRPLDGVDFSCRRGEFILIVGRSGSGKTTFLNVLGGLTRPTAGSVRIGGKEILNLSDAEAAALRSRTIGFVFQFPGLLSTLSAQENVALSAEIGGTAGKRASAERAGNLLERVGLKEKADSPPAHLSGGELKRTAIARALMNSPSLILADEPTADLDVDTEREVMELFREINREGTTVIMVTHNIDLASYASRVVRMEKGKLVPVEPVQ
ncbi:ABC transporter ATP-binding protein [Methanoregula sp.]|jgi:putative ABC transport system ATP-binding protein|uniref:ABC transporter ATP-binding protein n=1 Tax=Methanoregula sp. TaxID=2052170 RepID=UPI003C1560B9